MLLLKHTILGLLLATLVYLTGRFSFMCLCWRPKLCHMSSNTGFDVVHTENMAVQVYYKMNSVYISVGVKA